MKLSVLLTCILSVNMMASVYSQKARFDLDIKDQSVRDVLKTIEKESEFRFFYNDEFTDLDKKLTFSITDKSINDLMSVVLDNTEVGYKVLDNNFIVITPKSLLQQGKVTGNVTDENGNPLPGVTVLVKGTTIGTLTDATGKYSLIDAPQNAILSFSFVGMTTQEIPSNGQVMIDVVMKEEAIGLDEVVVIGYGTQKRVNLTGAVDVITNEKLSNRQVPNVSQSLQGLAPGIDLSIKDQDGFQPGANMAVTIRGMGSINGGEPYIIIDGFPGDINSINPDNVESISILKDAAASAIYGARAPYGVIIVTTKSGKKNEKMSVTYSGNVFVATPPPLPEMLDSYTYARVLNEAGDNRGGHRVSDLTVDRIIAYQNEDWEFLRQSIPDWPEGATHFGVTPVGNVWDNAAQNYANTDWWDIYYGQSVNHKHDLTLTGGSATTAYFFSAGYLQQEGVLNYGKDIFRRINILGKVNIAITKWWDFNWETRVSKKFREKFNGDKNGDYSYVFREISRAYPLTPLYDGWGNIFAESHILALEAGTDKIDDIDTWNNFKMEIRPVRDWKINADFGYNYLSGVESDVELTNYMHKVDNTLSPDVNSVPDAIERIRYDNNYWTMNIYSSYNLDINSIHNFTIMAGTQFEFGNNTTLSGYKTNLMVDDVPSLQTATGSPILTESLSHRATEGYFARFNYNYEEKYLLETNARYDGSYVFKKGNRWGFFPSFSLGWNVHKEPFWNNVEKYINTLKFRASWGQLGNQSISPYSDIELVPLNTGSLNWILNYGEPRLIGYTSPSSIVNKNLTWETSTTKNLGVNMSFLNNKLEASFDLFERLTSNMVGTSVIKPGVLGASMPRENNATLRTRGWELVLNWKDNFKSGLSYFIKLNLFDNRSVITKYTNLTGSLSTWYEGLEVGTIWGYTVYDLYRTQEELDNYLGDVNLSTLGTGWRTGDLKYEDINNDGKVDNGTNTINDHGDLSIIGNENPHYQYGITAGMGFKSFDFSMLWRGVAMKDIYFASGSNIFWGFQANAWEVCLTPRNLDYFRDAPGNKYSGLYEGDANINTDAYWPRPYLNSSADRKNKNYPNTRYLQDASYLRLQNIQVGYSLPQRIVSKLKIQNARISFSGENLFTFTKLPAGIDPVSPVGYPVGTSYGTAGTGRLTYGADRIYSFGISITY